jgi:hypothetical protein
METCGDTPIARSAVLITVTLSVNVGSCHEIGRELRRRIGKRSRLGLAMQDPAPVGFQVIATIPNDMLAATARFNVWMGWA